MKQFTLLVALLFAVASVAAQEQPDTTKQNQPTSPELGDPNELLHRGQRGELVLSLGMHKITLGNPTFEKSAVDSVAEMDEKKRPVLCWLCAMEFGVSLLAHTSYTDYTPEQYGFLDQRVGKSFHFGFAPLRYQPALNRRGSLLLVSGITFAVDNYRFDDDVSIAREGNAIVPVALEGKSKSKLTTAQWGFDLGLEYHPTRKVKLLFCGFGEVLVNSHTKVKSPKEKARMHGLNDFRFGLKAAVSYGVLGVYCKYALTPMFDTDIAPKCYPVSVGLAFCF